MQHPEMEDRTMTKNNAAKVENEHGVDGNMWRKWNAQQRALFNGTYEDIMNVGVDLFVHPVTVQRKLSQEEFQVIAWNAAFTAAGILKKEFTSEITTYYGDQVIAVDEVKQRAVN